MTTLTLEQRADYLEKVVIPNFKVLVNRDFCSVLYDTNGNSLIATDIAAKSIGLAGWEHSAGISYWEASNELLCDIFIEMYTAASSAGIRDYCRKVMRIQQYVHKQGTVINYIDLLPYKGQFKSYFVTLLPVYHPQGEIVALQSYAVECKFLGFHEQLADLLGKKEKVYSSSEIQFTAREQEILFLLTYGVTQDQIAQILNVSRGTVANIISKQLCVKFGIPGSNTKLLTEAAINAGAHQNMPQSLIHPCVMVLNSNFDDENLLDD